MSRDERRFVRGATKLASTFHSESCESPSKIPSSRYLLLFLETRRNHWILVNSLKTLLKKKIHKRCEIESFHGYETIVTRFPHSISKIANCLKKFLPLDILFYPWTKSIWKLANWNNSLKILLKRNGFHEIKLNHLQKNPSFLYHPLSLKTGRNLR